MSKAEKEILADKNFGVRLCATIDRIFQESGMKQMAINGSTGNYREIEMSFFKAIGSLNAVCESEPQSPAPTKEGLEERAEKWANENGFKVIDDDDESGASHKWAVDAYIAGAQSSLQPSSPDHTILVQALEKIATCNYLNASDGDDLEGQMMKTAQAALNEYKNR